MPAVGAAAPAANPPALNPVVLAAEPPVTIARMLVQQGWTENREGNFYFPGVAYPRIHITLRPDAANYDRNISIYNDVITVEVQAQRPGGDPYAHVFWLNNIKQRYDDQTVATALALLGAQAKLVLQEVLAD